MAAQGTAVVPTLVNVENFPGFAAAGETKFPSYASTMRRLYASSGAVVPLGTADYSAYLIQAKSYGPQVLINVEVADKSTVAQAPSVRTAVALAEAELGDSGRILLRPSGTEQVVRVMVEAADEDTARLLAVRVAESVAGEV